MPLNYTLSALKLFSILFLVVSLVPVYASTDKPKLTLTSDQSTLSKGHGTRIRWNAVRADSCAAVGGWTERTSPVDKHWVSSIDRTTTYTMTCTGAGGSVTKSLTISRSDNNDNDNDNDNDNNDNDNDNDNNEAPSLTFTSDLSTLEKDQSTRIRWNTARATSCQAVGGWTYRTTPEGKHWVSSIDRTTTYTMTCTGAGGSVSRSLTISLNNSTSEPEPELEPEPEPEPEPTLRLSTDDATLTANASTTIRWSSENTTSCSATGGWTAKSDVNGKQFISSVPSTTTYVMTCTGNGGSISQSITVNISSPDSSGSVALNWRAPTTNLDGTPLFDLAGYKIYYGTSQNNLNNVANVDAGLTTYSINNLTSGTYYFAISAIDLNNNESARSNIAARVVN